MHQTSPRVHKESIYHEKRTGKSQEKRRTTLEKEYECLEDQSKNHIFRGNPILFKDRNNGRENRKKREERGHVLQLINRKEFIDFNHQIQSTTIKEILQNMIKRKDIYTKKQQLCLQKCLFPRGISGEVLEESNEEIPGGPQSRNKRDTIR